MFGIKQLIISACTLVALTACSSENGGDSPIPSPPASEKLPIHISTSLTNRATDDAFENGDNIGLFVVNRNTDGSAASLQTTGNYIDNCKYTYQGTWTAATPTYWKDNTTHADFYIYYPYTPTITNIEAMPWSVKADQSLLSDYKSGDLLIGKTLNVAPSENAVLIDAKHLMSQMVITLVPGNGFSDATLTAANISVKVNHLKTKAIVNLATSDITAKEDAQNLPTDIIPLKEDDHYKALVIPQTANDGNLITVNVDGKDFNLQKASNFHAFEPGKRYNFTVTLNKTNNGVNVSITKWEDDGIDYGGTAE